MHIHTYISAITRLILPDQLPKRDWNITALIRIYSRVSAAKSFSDSKHNSEEYRELVENFPLATLLKIYGYMYYCE